jgi:recombination protein RecT
MMRKWRHRLLLIPTLNLMEDEKKTVITQFRNSTDLKLVLANQYMTQIQNYFGNEKKALRFLSSVIADAQRNPKLMECTPVSVVNSYMTMAQLEFLPSGVSGEAYVLPYKKNKKEGNAWVEVMEAQFQLGYQGLVTLFYRAGAKDIVAEIVREKDKFSYTNGVIKHKPNVFSDDRGKAIGAYVIVRLNTGGSVSKVMSAKEIIGIGQKFSKSFKSEHTPWQEENDPQLWMWRKTVLKQVAKLVPKNEAIVNAIAKDNEDSIIGDRMESAKASERSLTMGNLLKENENNQKEEGGQTESDAPEGDENHGTDVQG